MNADRTPKVVHVVLSLDPGGLERLVVNWTNGRNARATGSTEILCLDRPGKLAGCVHGNAVQCVSAVRSRFPFDFGAVRRLRGLLRESAEVCHSHNLAPWQYAALAGLGLPVRHVHTQHGENVHTLSPRNRLRSRLLATRSDAVVAVSEATAKAMVQNQGLSRQRMRVIPNGVDTQSFRPVSAEKRAALRTKADIASDALVLGWVGRLDPIKGVDRLIRVHAECLRRADSPRRPLLLLIGDGEARYELVKLTESLGTKDAVRFCGFREDPRDWIAMMDAFVLPSRNEGMPVGLLEGMAMGVPVLATGVGSVSQLLEDGRAGVILPADESGWPAVILDCAQGAGKQAALARAGRARERVEQHYSQTTTLDRYEALYGETMQGLRVT